MSDSDNIILAIGRLEGKMDSVLASQIEHVGRMNRIDENVELLDERVRKIEKKQFGIFLVAGVIWGFVTLAWNKIFH